MVGRLLLINKTSTSIVGRYCMISRGISSTSLRNGSRRKRDGSKLSQSSRIWLRRQEKDEYTKRARESGSPSRSIFKLEEIVKTIKNVKNKKTLKDINLSFLRRDDTVIDLGVSSI